MKLPISSTLNHHFILCRTFCSFPEHRVEKPILYHFFGVSINQRIFNFFLLVAFLVIIGTIVANYYIMYQIISGNQALGIPSSATFTWVSTSANKMFFTIYVLILPVSWFYLIRGPPQM